MLFIGALSLSAMETPSAASKYRLECERVRAAKFNPEGGFLDTNISAACAVICMDSSQELKEALIDKAFKKRQAMFSGDKVQDNTADYQYSEEIIRCLVGASDFLKTYVKQISLPKFIAAAMMAEDYDVGDAARLELPETHPLRFLLNPDLRDDDGDCFSNRAQYIATNFREKTNTLRSVLAACTTVIGLSSLLKIKFLLEPESWALSIFDESCKANLMYALLQVQEAALDGVTPGSPKYAKKLEKFRGATEWLFRPWWVPQSVKLQYYVSTGIEVSENEKAVDQKNDGKAEILDQLPSIQKDPSFVVPPIVPLPTELNKQEQVHSDVQPDGQVAEESIYKSLESADSGTFGHVPVEIAEQPKFENASLLSSSELAEYPDGATVITTEKLSKLNESDEKIEIEIGEFEFVADDQVPVSDGKQEQKNDELFYRVFPYVENPVAKHEDAQKLINEIRFDINQCGPEHIKAAKTVLGIDISKPLDKSAIDTALEMRVKNLVSNRLANTDDAIECLNCAADLLKERCEQELAVALVRAIIQNDQEQEIPYQAPESLILNNAIEHPVPPVIAVPEARAITASQKGLFTRFWDFACKRPYTTCGIVGATILGGYYAVKNTFVSNWLGRARSSFGSGLGNIPQRR